VSRVKGDARYTAVAIALHWLMALGILALVIMGLAMTYIDLPPMRIFQLYQLHKSVGISVLLAAVLRLAWRLKHPAPALPASMPRGERAAAKGGHILLYFCLFALPMTGWALVSVSVLNIPTVLYGVVPWPHLPVLSTLPDKAWAEALFKRVHAYGAWALIALVAGHAAAALRHHFVHRDDVLRRMLPASRPERVRVAAQTPGTESLR
jgi:cytochrome b561